MEDNLPFFVGRHPFLFKIKGGPKPLDYAVTNDDLTRLAEAYTRGPDGTKEATWRKYRHCKQLSDMMVLTTATLAGRRGAKTSTHFSASLWHVQCRGLLEELGESSQACNKLEQTEGVGTLTDAAAEEKEDGQPYHSDGSRDNEPEKEEHAEGPILVSDHSDSEKEHRRRGRPRVERGGNIDDPAPISDSEAESGDDYVLPRPLRGGPQGSRTLENRGYRSAQRGGPPLDGHKRRKKSARSARGALAREEENELMSKPKQLVDTPISVVSR
ncbi:hypothetical protein ARMGADRAFT_1022779 [Armillaria gallica]|uniref:Uncharacterized protein n=1 Tax=Armillaria gallica TaxID=47427 RepID=A0A2H3EYF6_ARMGA|nr:hypothetical protein ARMGADRAFT_1022779 [Armillaria gallica]